MSTTYCDSSEEAIFVRVKKHLGAVIGDPDLLAMEIGRSTKFGADLELESIEFITLADRLRTEFGEQVNFASFLSAKNVDDIISLKVGDVVDYVVICLHQAQA